MDREILVEIICNCGYEYKGPEQEAPNYGYECPQCGRTRMSKYRSLICHCGCEVWLNGDPNECEQCGQLYNAFGQTLAPPSQWDEQDRYDTFGPQNNKEER